MSKLVCLLLSTLLILGLLAGCSGYQKTEPTPSVPEQESALPAPDQDSMRSSSSSLPDFGSPSLEDPIPPVEIPPKEPQLLV